MLGDAKVHIGYINLLGNAKVHVWPINLLGDAKVQVDLPTCAKTIPILVVEVERRMCQRLSTFFLIDVTVPLALI